MAWPYAVGTATIANGASLSDAVALGGNVIVGFGMPAAWTAAELTFQGSFDGASFFDLYTEQTTTRTEKLLRVQANDLVLVAPASFAGLQAIKIRSGPSGSGVAQGAQRLISVVQRSIT
jgi:hypothetical protein